MVPILLYPFQLRSLLCQFRVVFLHSENYSGMHLYWLLVRRKLVIVYFLYNIICIFYCKYFVCTLYILYCTGKWFIHPKFAYDAELEMHFTSLDLKMILLLWVEHDFSIFLKIGYPSNMSCLMLFAEFFLWVLTLFILISLLW